jgi:Na+-transporting methylmalonyl-CoA/oxaloacetate decarboxylase gamma subunit
MQLTILAVAGKADVSILDALPHLAGMLMVMATLTILWGVCVVTAKLVQILIPENKPAAPAAPSPAAPAPVEKNDPVIAPEIVAVIAAAVAACTGGKVRIVSIKPTSSSWERAGRQSVLTSHRIR